ncbi:MAG: tRNA (adenosine(37)-N6)-threonylcarbamoyltransferase complex transferase subunit TsaD [Lentisphaerae bacterium]|nr:tRNA (adenosine(37)-N6)-threonylcarbamoyltransferase complex transferase subunit TsaD [Lentisphaerota bacterium]
MNILGIETSCDETSAAVVSGGRQVLSSVVRSQVELHGAYGGVVPEIAARSHVEALPSVIEKAVKDSNVGWDGIDAVSVTYGPGLASSLLVGLSAAKALSMRLRKPFCAINHIEAHIYSVFLGENAPQFESVCPFISLVVSGGHTSLHRVDGVGRYTLLGQTMDDAAGEAFDKGANLLGLGYPGGPAIDKAGANGKTDFVRFPIGRQKCSNKVFAGLDPKLCFSFSGLKTALRYYLDRNPTGGDKANIASIAASYQEAIVDALLARCRTAIRKKACLSVSGGVSLNSRLRVRLQELAEELRIRLLLAEPKYCADNAAMVAGLAGAGGGIWGDEAMNLDVEPSLSLGFLADSLNA